jgi:hypothetical protein
MNPAQIQAAQIATLDAAKALMPNGTRLFVNGKVIILTISGPTSSQAYPMPQATKTLMQP